MSRIQQHTRHRPHTFTPSSPPSPATLHLPLLPLPFHLLLLLLTLPLLILSAPAYNSPTCTDSSFLLANNLPLPPTNRPPLILERDGWAGHFLTTALAAHILRDALGYPIQVVDVSLPQGNLTSVFSRLGTAVTQMNFEVWPNSQAQADYTDFVLTGAAVSEGPVGLVQQSGWYTPTSIIQQNWDAYFDFWKGYRYDDLRAFGFSPAGTTADRRKVGNGREFAPPWCVLETEPAGCDPSYYNPAYLNRQCNITQYNPYCIEMWGIDAVQYDPGVVQQQIYNLHLNITLLFLGDWNYHNMIQTALATNRTFLAYDWTPSIDTSLSTLSRVALPSYTDACGFGSQNASTYFDGIGQIACDFPTQAILKYYSSSIQNDERYADAIHLMSVFNFANKYQQSLLPGMAALNASEWQGYADAGTCSWLIQFVKLWSSWISISPQQYTMQVPTAAWVPVMVILGVLASFSLLLHLFLYRHQRHPLVMSSSPFFGQIIISGSWFLYVAVGVMAWKQVNGVCSVIPIFLCIAYTLVVGTLFAKTWRLNRIFHGASLKSVRVTAWDVSAFILALFTVDFVINATWVAVDRPYAELITDSTNSLSLIYTCNSQYYVMWYSLLIVPKALLLCYGAFLAYNVRHISQNFNESRYIALAILHFLLFGVIVIPLDQALYNQLIVHYLLVTLMLCLCVTVTLSLIFLPKIYAITYKKKGKKSPAKDDLSKEDPPADEKAGHRWMRDQAIIEGSDSAKLSFPSLTSGEGFQHAMKLVRLIAENLYREHGIAEYFQFCVAVRHMSQAELEARAPLLMNFLTQIQGTRGVQGVGEVEQKVRADAPTLDEPQSQAPMMTSFTPNFPVNKDQGEVELMSIHTVDVDGADHSYPITQVSYSAPQSGTVPPLSLPPLPAEAWTVDASQASMVEKAVLDFTTASTAPTSPASHSPTTAFPQQSTVTSVSSHLSFPLDAGSFPMTSQPNSSSLISQASFSVSGQAVQGGIGGGSMSLPSPMSSGSSAHTPSSPPNHHSSTSRSAESGGSRGEGEGKKEGIKGDGMHLERGTSESVSVVSSTGL